MKKLLITLLMISLLWGVVAATYQLETMQKEWELVGTATSAAAGDPAVAARSYATISATSKVATYNVVGAQNIAEFCFTGPKDANTFVVEVYASRAYKSSTLSSMSKVCTLTMTTGKQVESTGRYFIDTIVVSNEFWLTSIVQVDIAGADRISRIAFDTCGYRYFSFVPTTVNGTLKIYGTGF